MFNRYHTNNPTFYNPTFYDRLFAIIALLVIICCIPHAAVGEIVTGGAAAVIAFIASIVTITVATATLLAGIHTYITSQDKDLKGLEKELKKLNDRKDDRNDDLDDLNDKIENLETELDLKRPGLDAAWQKMIAAGTTLGEKAEVVESSEVEYGEAVSAHDTHNTYCYNVQNGHPCTISDNLYTAMKDAEKDLQIAKRLHNDAVHANKRATKAHKKLSKEFGKIAKKLADLEEDKADLEDDLANDQKRINELGPAIEEKQRLIVQATSDGELVEEAEENAPGYMESFNAAKAAGADMEEWVKICPPPESVKKFVEEFSRLQSTYEENP